LKLASSSVESIASEVGEGDHDEFFGQWVVNGSQTLKQFDEQEQEQEQNQNEEEEAMLVPIVYSDGYNIKFGGLEKLHPFDSCKYEKIAASLGLDRFRSVQIGRQLSPSELLTHHSEAYLKSLQSSWNVAAITEVPPVALVPNFLLQRSLLSPMRLASAGSLVASYVALKRHRRVAVNLGGGFHHCSADEGGGFCAYADISIAMRYLRERGLVERVLYIDCDAHQGNGVERDKLAMSDRWRRRTAIVDVYNEDIYPHDTFAKQAIDIAVPLRSGTSNARYLQRLRSAIGQIEHRYMSKAAADAKRLPDMIMYNAGTDVLDGDPLGAMHVSADGVVERDALVFDLAKRNDIPIVMFLSGGYTALSAPTVAQSLKSLLFD
jgi:histone deacetylase 11